MIVKKCLAEFMGKLLGDADVVVDMCAGSGGPAGHQAGDIEGKGEEPRWVDREACDEDRCLPEGDSHPGTAGGDDRGAGMHISRRSRHALRSNGEDPGPAGNAALLDPQAPALLCFVCDRARDPDDLRGAVRRLGKKFSGPAENLCPHQR